MGKRTASRRQHGTNKGKLTPRKGVKTKKARTQKPNNLKDKQTTKFSYEVLEDSSVESNSTNHTRDSNDNDKNLCRMLDSTFKSADDFYNSDSSTSGNAIIERIKKRHEFRKQKEANDLKTNDDDSNEEEEEKSEDDESVASEDLSATSYQAKPNKNKKNRKVTYAQVTQESVKKSPRDKVDDVITIDDKGSKVTDVEVLPMSKSTPEISTLAISNDGCR